MLIKKKKNKRTREEIFSSLKLWMWSKQIYHFRYIAWLCKNNKNMYLYRQQIFPFLYLNSMFKYTRKQPFAFFPLRAHFQILLACRYQCPSDPPGRVFSSFRQKKITYLFQYGLFSVDIASSNCSERLEQRMGTCTWEQDRRYLLRVDFVGSYCQRPPAARILFWKDEVYVCTSTVEQFNFVYPVIIFFSYSSLDPYVWRSTFMYQ